MTGVHQSIALLPLEAQAQIRSSVQITSLSDVVLELVKNSLDANAKHIHIQVDFLKGYCAVLDDGDGILKGDFLEGGGLGQLYHTSKSSLLQRSYGRYGRFLASLSAVSLLSITSCHLASASVNSITIKDGQHLVTSLDINDESISGYSHGTKVVVYNLFGRMPVRVKYRVAQFSGQHGTEKEFSSLRHSLVGLNLASSKSFSLDVKADPRRYVHKPQDWVGQDLRSNHQLEQVVSILFQAGLLDSASNFKWRQALVESSGLLIQAFFCLQPAPSKANQYISLNHQPLSSMRYKSLFDQVNTPFDLSTFGASESGENHELTHIGGKTARPPNKQFVRGRKEIDRWPVFYISIHLDNSTYRLDESEEPGVGKLTALIGGCLHALVTEFLQTHGYEIRQMKRLREARLSSSKTRQDSMTSLSNFDYWSQIKSGNSTPTDLLNGLPFLIQPRQSTQLTSTCRSPRNELNGNRVIEKNRVFWIHPRSGDLLNIDSRTGMVLSSSHRDTKQLPTISPRLMNWRQPADVMNSLRDYLPAARMETPVKSIVPDHDTISSTVSTDHICILNCNERLTFNGPNCVDSADPALRKLDLKTANVHGQVNGQFVLASVVSDDDLRTTVFLIDQHAADERVRVEALYQQLCGTISTPLLKPIIFEVNTEELKRFERLRSYFAQWQIQYSVLPWQICVSALPDLITERCRLNPKLLIDLLRKEVWQDRPDSSQISANATSWLDKIGECPQGILDLLASRACRTAIMFNDELTIEQCRELVRRLALCVFPFQCAHGRPSLTVVTRFREVGIPDETDRKVSSSSVGWQFW